MQPIHITYINNTMNKAKMRLQKENMTIRDYFYYLPHAHKRKDKFDVENLCVFLGYRTEELQVNIFTLFDHADKIMANKQQEYATKTDRLHNFRVAGKAIGGLPMSEVCYMFMLKHIISISELTIEASEEIKLEKLGDMYNYLILFCECLMEENKVTF